MVAVIAHVSVLHMQVVVQLAGVFPSEGSRQVVASLTCLGASSSLKADNLCCASASSSVQPVLFFLSVLKEF